MSRPAPKRILAKGWACVGSHGKIYVTDYSPHEACVGRYQVYQTKADALNNSALGQEPIKVVIMRAEHEK